MLQAAIRELRQQRDEAERVRERAELERDLLDMIVATLEQFGRLEAGQIRQLLAQGPLGAPGKLQDAQGVPAGTIVPPGPASPAERVASSAEPHAPGRGNGTKPAPLVACARPGCTETFRAVPRKKYCGDPCRNAVWLEGRKRAPGKPPADQQEPPPDPFGSRPTMTTSRTTPTTSP